MAKMPKRLARFIDDLNYVDMVVDRTDEFSPRSKQEYYKHLIRFGRLCKKICKREGWKIEQEVFKTQKGGIIIGRK